MQYLLSLFIRSLITPGNRLSPVILIAADVSLNFPSQRSLLQFREIVELGQARLNVKWGVPCKHNNQRSAYSV
jgi:hypothetical protein